LYSTAPSRENHFSCIYVELAVVSERHCKHPSSFDAKCAGAYDHKWNKILLRHKHPSRRYFKPTQAVTRSVPTDMLRQWVPLSADRGSLAPTSFCFCSFMCQKLFVAFAQRSGRKTKKASLRKYGSRIHFGAESVSFTCGLFCSAWNFQVVKYLLLWRWLSSGILRRVVWSKFADVSEMLAASIIYPPDEGCSKHLWNVGKLLPGYMAQCRRRQSSSYSPPWEPEL
jgi:hypothetical protein